MKHQLKEALHRYKVEAFKLTHHSTEQQDADVAREILGHTAEAMQNAYHFHFDGKEQTNPHQVETFQMIKQVTLETILPPVLEKVMLRVTVLERQNQELVKLLDELMEILSED